MARDARAIEDQRLADLVQAGWDAYHAGRERWLRVVLARLRGLSRDAPEVLDLEWRLLFLRGDLDLAMDEARRGAALHPDDPALNHSCGWCLLELADAEDALPFLERACTLDPASGDAWYDLGVARERLGDEPGMQEAFGQTWRLDREAAGEEPLRIDPGEFEEILRRAVAELPTELLQAMANVVVIQEDYPDAWILDAPPYDPRLFGLFVGPVYAEVLSNQAAGAEPTRIYLYQRNLERQFGHPDDLAVEIRVTLIHEIGHYLGLEEQDLEERGWL